MSESAESDARRTVTVDLVGHARSLLRVALPALLVGVVVAIGVFAVQSTSATTYESSVVAQVVIPGTGATGQSGPTSTDAATVAGPYVALVGDQGVLSQIGKSVGSDLTSDELSRQITVAPAQIPGIIDVTARADTAAQASKLATATVTTLDATYTARQQSASPAPSSGVSPSVAAGLTDMSTQLSALRSQLDGVIQSGGTASGQLDALSSRLNQLRGLATGGQNTGTQPSGTQNSGTQNSGTQASATSASPVTQRLIVLARPAGAPATSTIPPSAIALVAGLVAAILAAELLIVARTFLGRSVTPEWARRAVRRVGATVDVPRRGMEVSHETLATVGDCEGSIIVVGSDDVRNAVSRIVSFAHHHVDGREIDDEVWYRRDGDHALGIIVVREGDGHRPEVITALENLAAWSVPTVLVVAPRVRGTVGLPGDLTLSFRKPDGPVGPVDPSTPDHPANRLSSAGSRS
jgi:capsular polysaccharide biosynthesis protein